MRKGTKHTPESLKKLSQSLKGRISPNKGKKFSKEWKKKLSDSHKGRVMSESSRQKLLRAVRRGKDHPNYKHGLYGTAGYQRPYQKAYYNRRRDADGFHTIQEWEELKARYNWICPWCGRREPEIILTKDHIIPLSIGGSDNIENIQPLCRSCNSRKKSKVLRFNPKLT